MTFCYILPVERLFYVSSNNQPTYWDSTCICTAFPWWKYPGEIGLRSLAPLPRDFLGRCLSESLRNAP